MKRRIVLSKIASKKLSNLFDYLEINWSEKLKNDFIKRFDRTIKILENNPKSFPASLKYPDIRKCVVTKHISYFYKFDDTNIYILTVFDNRQNPDRIDIEISKIK